MDEYQTITIDNSSDSFDKFCIRAAKDNETDNVVMLDVIFPSGQVKTLRAVVGN